MCKDDEDENPGRNGLSVLPFRLLSSSKVNLVLCFRSRQQDLFDHAAPPSYASHLLSLHDPPHMQP